MTAQFPSTIHFLLRTSQRWIERPLGGCDRLVELLFEPRRNSSQVATTFLAHSMYSNRRLTTVASEPPVASETKLATSSKWLRSGFLSDALAALVDMPSCRRIRRSEDCNPFFHNVIPCS
jgi:hypothetical protein